MINCTVTPLAKRMANNSYGKSCLPLSSPAKKTNMQEEVFDFSTIDGGVITYNAGTKAISNGAGIFIGDYFVGISDSYHSISNLPFVRY
ncbi:hypothetical protein ABID22_002383 [Pontibacter aydingkolensis]|uniref:Peptidase A1 domain-containing protein n=1 Tax=Pontibacter aydingkolensis TaxID=1911536 RepID=A0ABS7CVT5_9BACT|nr:hypothetical protein [Pontibacter aydingkolensis]MBW7467984.1 hypothetical protein [Pontibacter aydingkolensis]